MSTSPSNSIITPGFLEQIFGQKVKDFVCRDGTKSGDNYLSKIYSVAVTFQNSKQNQKHIIIKFYPENEATRGFLDSVSLFQTEYLIYNELLPALNKLVDKVKSEDFYFNVAAFYGGNIVGNRKLSTFSEEPWINENLIILEDVRKRGSGFKMLNRTNGLDLKHCLLAINQLANLHALSWVYKQRNKLDFLVDKHSYLKDAMYRVENEAGWRPVVESMNKNALKVVLEELGETSDIFKKFRDLLSNDVFAIIRIYLSGKGVNEEKAEKLLRLKPDEPPSASQTAPWLVATHGDLWICNLLYSYDEDNRPTEVVPVDFQAFRETCLTIDLAYFLYSSTTVELRKQSINIILEVYFERFQKICSAFQVETPVGFTMQNLKRRWRRSRVYSLLMSIQFLTFIFKPQENTKKSDHEYESSSSKSVEDAYSDVVRGTDGNMIWRKAIIDTVTSEYEDGIL